MNLKTLGIDESWALFLDRDGVINHQKADDYIRNWDEFMFLPGVLESFPFLNTVFGRIIIVTNQQGIGKGLMSSDSLNQIHDRMIEAVSKSGGRIDKIYFSPHLSKSRHFDRKPSIGMALKARKELGVNLKKSIMVGDSLSDMIFGRNAGMKTVLIKNDPAMAGKFHKLIDFYFESLELFAQQLYGMSSFKLKQ